MSRPIQASAVSPSARATHSSRVKTREALDGPSSDADADADAPGVQARTALKQGLLDQAIACLEAHWQHRSGLDPNALDPDDITAETSCQLGQALIAIARFAEARTVYERARSMVQAEALRTRIWLGLATVRYRQGDYADALELFHQTLQQVQRLGDAAVEATVLNHIGAIHKDMGDYDEAIAFYQKSLTLAQSAQLPSDEATSWNNLGSLLSQRGELEQALECYHKSLELKRRLQDRRGEAATRLNMGNLFFQQGQYDMAKEYIEQAQSLWDSEGYVLGVAYCLRALGRLYGETSWHGSSSELALNHLRQGLMLAQQVGARKLETSYQLTLSDVYEKQGMLAEALHHSRELYRLDRLLVGEEAAQRIRQLQVQHQTELFRLQAESLERELSARHQELAALALALSEKDDLLRKLKSQVQQEKRLPPRADRSFLNGLLEQLDASLGVSRDQSWGVFEKHFELTHGGFLPRLMQEYPSLSAAERRLCALLRINLSPHDVARVLNITPKTIEVHRGNIRKKLGLSPEVSLGRFLAELG